MLAKARIKKVWTMDRAREAVYGAVAKVTSVPIERLADRLTLRMLGVDHVADNYPLRLEAGQIMRVNLDEKIGDMIERLTNVRTKIQHN